MKDIETNLKPEWELFCQYFASQYETFGNATRSYGKAYNIDITQKKGYNTAKVNGHKLLTNANILDRINELLKDLVLNDTTVDMQLAFLITQMNDYSAKVQAIREYNKLKQRITEKREIKVDSIEAILEASGLRKEINQMRAENDGQNPESVSGASESQAQS